MYAVIWMDKESEEEGIYTCIAKKQPSLPLSRSGRRHPKTRRPPRPFRGLCRQGRRGPRQPNTGTTADPKHPSSPVHEADTSSERSVLTQTCYFDDQRISGRTEEREQS